MYTVKNGMAQYGLTQFKFKCIYSQQYYNNHLQQQTA